MNRAVLAMLAGCGAASASVRGAIHEEYQIAPDVALVEDDAGIFGFARDHVEIVRGGSVQHHVAAPMGARWDGVAVLRLQAAARSWIVGVAGGALWRLFTDGGLERVDARFGITGTAAIDAAGETFIIGHAGGVATSADGVHVLQLAAPRPRLVAAARGRVAYAGAASVEVLELGARSSRRYDVRDVTRLAFLDPHGAKPRLVIATGAAVYVESAGRLVPLSTPGPVSRIEVAGPRLWLMTKTALYAYDAHDLRRVTLPIPLGSVIHGSSSGDLWLVDDGRTVRLSLDLDADRLWSDTVEPIFQRVCSGCHADGTESGVDLSTAARWRASRAQLQQRVVIERSMPPQAADLTEHERQVIGAWLAR